MSTEIERACVTPLSGAPGAAAVTFACVTLRLRNKFYYNLLKVVSRPRFDSLFYTSNH